MICFKWLQYKIGNNLEILNWIFISFLVFQSTKLEFELNLLRDFRLNSLHRRHTSINWCTFCSWSALSGSGRATCSTLITPNSSVTELCGKTIGNWLEFATLCEPDSSSDAIDADEEYFGLFSVVIFSRRLRRTLFTIFPTIGSPPEQIHDDSRRIV